MPFIKVNCAAIPETLLESELFGHVKGAFTDATATRKGKFSLADRGSIFLDEIGTMSVGLQAKLLRVLQEREIEPLGGERTERVDVRVIAATNRDLQQLVGLGQFQDDLFYRLHVVPIVVPPLRERLEDIPMLVEWFVHKHAARCGKFIESLEEGGIAKLLEYHWPGNVRELENAIERAVVLTIGSTITREAITVGGTLSVQTAGVKSFKLRENIEWIERETIRRALRSVGGQATSREAHGHQPPRAVLLPGQVPIHRSERELTRLTGAAACGRKMGGYESRRSRVIWRATQGPPRDGGIHAGRARDSCRPVGSCRERAGAWRTPPAPRRNHACPVGGS